MKIILCGYMGSGKSAVGQVLARKLQLPFIDLDQAIEKEAQQTVAEIFKKKGELYFRKKEHEVFKHLVEKSDPAVISLGGGTPCYGNNAALLTAYGVISFYLKVGLDVLTERLFLEKDKRPLIASQETKEKLNDFIRKHLFERQFYYLQSQHTIDCGAKTAAVIVNEIETFL